MGAQRAPWWPREPGDQDQDPRQEERNSVRNSIPAGPSPVKGHGYSMNRGTIRDIEGHQRNGMEPCRKEHLRHLPCCENSCFLFSERTQNEDFCFFSTLTHQGPGALHRMWFRPEIWSQAGVLRGHVSTYFPKWIGYRPFMLVRANNLQGIYPRPVHQSRFTCMAFPSLSQSKRHTDHTDCNFDCPPILSFFGLVTISCEIFWTRARSVIWAGKQSEFAEHHQF